MKQQCGREGTHGVGLTPVIDFGESACDPYRLVHVLFRQPQSQQLPFGAGQVQKPGGYVKQDLVGSGLGLEIAQNDQLTGGEWLKKAIPQMAENLHARNDGRARRDRHSPVAQVQRARIDIKHSAGAGLQNTLMAVVIAAGVH